MFKNKQGGFTLLELLIVIAMIGVLQSVILASLGESRVNARDTQRVAQLKEVEKALELYYADNGTYVSRLDALDNKYFVQAKPLWQRITPINTAFANNVWEVGCFVYGEDSNGQFEAALQDYIPTSAIAPKGDAALESNFLYAASADGQQYCIGTNLEREQNVPRNRNTNCLGWTYDLSVGFDPNRGYALGNYDGRTTTFASLSFCNGY